jgi:hypothetical protein
MRRQLVIAFAFVALAAVSVGCGGGSGNGDAGSASLTPKAFVEKADAICTKSENRIAAEFKAFQEKEQPEKGSGKGESPEEAKARTLEAIEAVGIPQLRQLHDELRELEAPASKEADMTAYLDALEKEIEAGEEDAQALNGSPEEIFAKSEAAAKDLGFKTCAKKNP